MKEPNEMAGVARAAGIVAAANITSRVLGLVRDVVKSNFFGSTGLVSAFDLATKIPQMFYDLLVGGMVSAALVPVFSEYARDPKNRAELWQVASLLLTVGTVILAGLVAFGEIFAPWLAYLIGSNLPPDLLALTTNLLRITLPALFFLNIAGVLAGLLYSLKRFALPAFNPAIFNLAIVVVTFLFTAQLGIYAMAWGLLLGSIAQVALQVWGLRHSSIRIWTHWRHPALPKIGKLYLPILVGLIVDIFSRTLSYNLATATGETSVAYMNYATTLMQFPLGLTSVAVAAAILPTLSRQAIGELPTTFLKTLGGGIRLVLVLIIPATVALAILAQPIISLLFEHGNFTPENTRVTTDVLRLYLIGVIPAALDLLLINAFYARQDPLTPALVGLVGVGGYLALALGIGWVLHRPMMLTDLMIANAAQLILHTALMAWLLTKKVGRLHGQGILKITAETTLAAAAMGAVLWVILELLTKVTFPWQLLTEVVYVVLPSALGGIGYLACLLLLRVPEANWLLQRFRWRRA